MIDGRIFAEARAWGADCILIVMAAVDDALALDLSRAAKSLSMDVLAEVHDEAELDRALALDTSLMGINNRDLKRFVTDLAVTRHFYVELLGLEVLADEGGYLRLGSSHGGFTIGMEERAADEVGAPGIEIDIQVDDVDAAYARLLAAGVRTIGPPAEMDWGGRHLFLTDHDGYRLSLFSPPD